MLLERHRCGIAPATLSRRTLGANPNTIRVFSELRARSNSTLGVQVQGCILRAGRVPLSPPSSDFRTPRVGGVGYAGVEVGMVCRYAFAEPPRRFMRVSRYRYSASGRLYTPHARKHGVCRYGSASVQMSLREVCRYVSSVQPLPLHTIPPQRGRSRRQFCWRRRASQKVGLCPAS